MTYIIAEIGNNHEGDPRQLLELVGEAIDAGASAVKFQVFRAEELVNPTMKALVEEGTQLGRLKRLELPICTYQVAAEMCKKAGVEVIATPLSLDMVSACGFADVLKISSGDMSYVPLLKEVARTNKRVIMSTGMATMNEVIESAEYFRNNELVLMHCVSLYPCPKEKANLNRIKKLRAIFPNNIVGYSDHCQGQDAISISLSMEVPVVEKHFTIQKLSEYPGDHEHSMTPNDLKYFINTSRLVESMIHGGELADYHNRSTHMRQTNGLRGEVRGVSKLNINA